MSGSPSSAPWASRGQLTACMLVSGTGQLPEPAVPELPGLDRFEGAAFHSARRDHSRDLAALRWRACEWRHEP